MKKRYSNTAAVIASAFALAACGGSGDVATTSVDAATVKESASVSEVLTTNSESTMGATQEVSTTATQTSTASVDTSTSNTTNTTVNQEQENVAATTFADCFEITPGVKFSTSNGSQSLGVHEQFEGQMAYSQMELRMDGTRFGGSYHVVTDGYVQLLGMNDYTQAGEFSSKTVNSTGAKLPAGLAIGEKADISYTATWTSQSGSSFTETVSRGYTLVGFETMTLGGRNFENVCKVKITEGSANSIMLWMAKGFGVIRSEQQDTQGNTIAGTRNELTVITAMP